MAAQVGSPYDHQTGQPAAPVARPWKSPLLGGLRSLSLWQADEGFTSQPRDSMSSAPIPLPSRAERLRRIADLIGEAQERFAVRMAEIAVQRGELLAQELNMLINLQPIPGELSEQADALDAQQLLLMDQMATFLKQQDAKARQVMGEAQP